MAIDRTLIYETNQGTGNPGFRPTWFENADALGPVALFHDICEHFPGQQSPVAGELQAIGAYAALRFDSSDAQRAIGSTVRATLTDMIRDNLEHPAPLRSRPLLEGYLYEEDAFQAGAESGILGALEEGEYLDAESFSEHLQWLEDSVPTLVSWMRKGFRMAQRRYAGASLYDMGRDLRETLHAYGKELIDSKRLEEGDEIRVSLDVRRLTVRMFVNGQCAQQHAYL